MEHTRLELRLSSSPGNSRVTLPGTVGGAVVGIIIDPNGPLVLQTQVTARVAHQLNQQATTTPLAHGILLDGQTAVLIKKKKVMYRIKRVWVQRDSGTITHILLADSNFFASSKPEHVVPADQIATFESKNVVLLPTIESVEHFPVYRDDAEIARDVGTVLEQVLMDPRARRGIHARVEDARVEFSGILDNENLNEALQAGVSQIPGVRGVRSDIIVTERLAVMALAALDELRAKGRLPEDAEIEVLSEHQILYLHGTVPSSKVSTDAENAALGVPGVRIVVNNLRVVGTPTIQSADPASPRTHNR